MGSPPSKINPENYPLLYPEPSPPYERAEGVEPIINLGNGHKLHAQEFGNPRGEPLIILHGGPGGGCSTLYARYFDPQRYRIIMFDQRGCGYSTPTTQTDLAGAMKGNNTAELVKDIEAVRGYFNITGKMHIEGGSWGSTLALAYAIKYPQNVKSLLLRGVYLGTPEGMDYGFQGNAATYEEAPAPLTDESTPEEVQTFLDHYNRQDSSFAGSYRAYMGDGTLSGQISESYRKDHHHMIVGYARTWDEYVRVIPKSERGDMVGAYVKRLEATADASVAEYDLATNRINPDYQKRLAVAFAKWEGMSSNFNHAVAADGRIDLNKFADPDFAVDFARLEARYTRDGFYLTEDGRPSPGGSRYLLDNLKRIAREGVSMYLVNGAQDQVCPPQDAITLKTEYEKALRAVRQEADVKLVLPEQTGHSMLEEGNTRALIEFGRQLPKIHATGKAVRGDIPKE